MRMFIINVALVLTEINMFLAVASPILATFTIWHARGDAVVLNRRPV